jgi:ribosomal protein S18 acetylase RimI-like enzyme
LKVALSVEPAVASTPPEHLADLFWNTDPTLNAYMFQRRDVLLDVLRCEWPEDRGLLCHKQSVMAVDGASILGVLVGHTEAEYGANFEAAQALQVGRLSEDDAAHMVQSLGWMDRLFPPPRAQSYYVLELSTAPSAQGSGVASHLLDAAEARARSAGCTHISLDVAADNEAVGFYRHKGFEVEIETRVPYLADTYGIGLHLHMMRSLSVAG